MLSMTDLVQSFFTLLCYAGCAESGRFPVLSWTLTWPGKNVVVEERRCRPFSEHLVLSWCYPPCRVSTASDPAVCGAGLVTDSVDVVVVACALDCGTPFAVGLQLLCCMLMWVCPLGVPDSGSRWYVFGYVYVLILLYCQKRHYSYLLFLTICPRHSFQ